MSAIKITNLVKTYANGTQALKGINFEVEKGDFCALLGANGAGKTTIIGILTSLVYKTSGQAEVFGFDTASQPTLAKQTMGVVPQEVNFNAFERVQEIVVQQAGYFGINRSIAMKDSEVLLKRLDLWDKRHTFSRQLSGGMKRLMMIARALINKPKLLILDEPTAGVDVELRHSIWDFIRGLNEQGTTVLLTTHYLEEVEQMCRNAAIIKNGEIISFDRVSRLVNLLEKETYIIYVDRVHSLDKLKKYNPKPIDGQSFEMDFCKKERLNDLMNTLSRYGLMVHDVRPKGSRIEQLFLNILKG